MSGMFERAELLVRGPRRPQGPPLSRGRPAPARRRCCTSRGTLAAEGWQPVYLDLPAAATSPERFVQAALGAARRDWTARGRARRGDQLSRTGGVTMAAAVLCLARGRPRHGVDGRPRARDRQATEIRSLAYFSGLRESTRPSRPPCPPGRGDAARHLLPGVARKRWPQMATLAMPPLSAAELQGEARRRGLRADGSALAAASFGWPRYARILLERLEQGQSLATAWAEEMALGGRLEQACRHTYEVLLLRSRGYGMSKAVLAAVAAEEGLNLTALVARLGRTPGAIRDYLGWLLAVDALRTTRKRYYYVDGVLRLWVRLHARGVRASEEEILSCARELLATAAPAPAADAVAAASRHQGLMEID